MTWSNIVTFRTKSDMETDKNLAMFATTIHFPLPELRGFWDLIFFVLLPEGLITTSKSQISTCSFGSFEIKPKSLTNDWRRLSLISPTETDSIAPCKLQKSQHEWHDPVEALVCNVYVIENPQCM